MNDNYSTPLWILNFFNGWFDPCSLSNGELRNFDGLGSSWGFKTFVNPPYSQTGKWVSKAILENKKGKLIVMLLKVDTSTIWFKELINANAEILFFYGRLRFGNKCTDANFPSMLVVLNPR